jgi:hypothetical protein
MTLTKTSRRDNMRFYEYVDAHTMRLIKNLIAVAYELSSYVFN